MNDLADNLCNYIGEIVTIYTESGGGSSKRFTGVLSCVNDCYIRLISSKCFIDIAIKHIVSFEHNRVVTKDTKVIPLPKQKEMVKNIDYNDVNNAYSLLKIFLLLVLLLTIINKKSESS